MKLTVTFDSQQISIIIDCMETKIKALNHVIKYNSFDSELLDSELLKFKNEISKCEKTIKQLSSY
ncbi:MULTISPECIES: hypothetical protein [unclassified Pseudoalteromonas]|jgi:hypothetical protein|uniref:hypothetical protein n=1 Tax=unclassified Pseudoalteromonas TaxID=194690 RepID=UPI0016049912|nr:MULTISPECIES: hypothetical protein [unclassified Pseudoalteromonas]MBB1352379.1 hypothetical protein [Pseudoalteromonas sp. SG45-3]MBB1360485.1 hypothetical protein [Pseudoalteromonas sp. SG45-6]